MFAEKDSKKRSSHILFCLGLFATLHGVVFHFFVRDAEVIFAIGADEAHARHRAQHALRLLARGATGVALRMNDLSDPALVKEHGVGEREEGSPRVASAAIPSAS